LLYVAFDCSYIEQAEFDRLMSLANEEARILGGLRAAVERQRDSNR
jgi:hypothetical protein